MNALGGIAVTTLSGAAAIAEGVTTTTTTHEHQVAPGPGGGVPGVVGVPIGAPPVETGCTTNSKTTTDTKTGELASCYGE